MFSDNLVKFSFRESVTSVRVSGLEKAQLLFEKLLGYANHLGLYSEELGADGRHLGNFPQAFTHLALISAASYLDRALSGTTDATWR